MAKTTVGNKAEKELVDKTCACNELKSKCICKSTKLIKKDGKFKIEPIKPTGQ